MKISSFRTCFILSTAVLVVSVFCCGLLVVVLAFQQGAPAADATTLARQLEERLLAARVSHQSLADLWGQLQTGEGAPCSTAPTDPPDILLIRPNEERDHPQLAQAVAQLNHAIDRLHWAADAWRAACSGPAPASEAAGDAQGYLDEARAALDKVEAMLLAGVGG